jgi:hypothetical protein
MLNLPSVKVTYDHSAPSVEILVDGNPFDVSRLNGRTIDEWAYEFMFKGVHWHGFYSEIASLLDNGGAFTLIFEGEESALNILRETLKNEKVTIIHETEPKTANVVIEYTDNPITTKITIDGENFDTSRIDGRPIEEWVYPIMFRGVKEWNGIFAELKNASGCEKHNIEFVGSESAMQKLSAECPESVVLTYNSSSTVVAPPKTKSEKKPMELNSNIDKPQIHIKNEWLHWIVDSNIGKYSINGETIFTHALNLMKMASSSRIKETGFPMPVPNGYNFNPSEVEEAKNTYLKTLSLDNILIADVPNKDMEECLTLFDKLYEEICSLGEDLLP